MTTAVEAMNEISRGLAPATLDRVTTVADLQTRTDRKYLLPIAEWRDLVARLQDRLRVLEISGSRQFDYESVYFDTSDLLAYHRHAHGRRVRFKIRTRSYVDSGQTMLELKTKGGRGETVKDRYDYRFADRYELDSAARALIQKRLGTHLHGRRPEFTMITNYLRSTLLDTVAGSRLTCDVGLTFTDSGHTYRAPDDLVLVESKTTGSSTPLETGLWRMGHRPVSISKYCTGLALLHPQLPANRWNRTLRQYFDWTPAPDSLRKSPVPEADAVEFAAVP